MLLVNVIFLRIARLATKPVTFSARDPHLDFKSPNAFDPSLGRIVVVGVGAIGSPGKLSNE